MPGDVFERAGVRKNNPNDLSISEVNEVLDPVDHHWMRLTASKPAAPIPATPRPASIVGIFSLPVLIALPTKKNRRPIWRAQCLPNMSAMEANGGRKTVEVRR